MNDYTGSIRKIGLINSGMFDTLVLNFDVKAIHLVGANNVGKTSLIALIQFLFFPNVNEMTFIKSVGESINFYFRPEGSYILFEVRTITGNIRTVGVHGTGQSDSRVNFVFNGSFEIRDFLDSGNLPVPLQDLQADFFSRDFARFDKFERYEEALLGQHTDGRYNVPLFDLSKTNYRLLRKLMQGLLRLDRIDAADVQQLLIQIVEKGAIRTRFNLAQDFEQKYRHINGLRVELQELEVLKPLMVHYQRIVAQLAQKEEHRQHHAERLYHLSSIYREHLATQKASLADAFDAQEERIDKLGQSIKDSTARVNRAESAMAEMKKLKNRFEALVESTRDQSEALIKKERDDLTHARVELQKALAAARPQNAAGLKGQLAALARKLDGLMRQRDAKTLQQVWAQADFDDAHRALLEFLVGSDLASLDPSDVLSDPRAFVEASARVAEFLDAAGNFAGFGLKVPRSVWFVPEADQEPLDARVARLENDMARIRIDIDISENLTKKKKELAALDTAIQAKEALLKDFAELEQLTDRWQGPGTLEAEHNRLSVELKRLELAVAGKEEASKTLRRQQHLTHTALQVAQDLWRHVCREHETLRPFGTPASDSLYGLSPEALSSEYEQVRVELDDIVKAITRLEQDLKAPKNELEGRYEKSGQEIPFEQWLARKSNLADEIQGLETQLQREYDAIFTLVRAKLSKITQAYQSVESQVAALNKTVRNVRISNIEQIGITLEQTELLDAIDQSIPGQLDLFATRAGNTPLAEAHARVEEYFSRIKQYGNEINLKDMFRLKFSVQFNYQPKPIERYEIHRFESNGTETGVKIVIYLGLIGLLQERKNIAGTRIPFFLDEVGSIDSDNLNQLIGYCTNNSFLPIFASPEIRKDISHNYLFRRNGNRSYLASVVKITKRQPDSVQDDSSDMVDHPA